jgi:hypothetical protein
MAGTSAHAGDPDFPAGPGGGSGPGGSRPGGSGPGGLSPGGLSQGGLSQGGLHPGGAPSWDGLVVNERRGALVAAAAALRAAGVELAASFDHVTALLDGGAWAGRAASAWGIELSRVRSAVAAALDAAALDCAGAAGAEPDRVAPDDSRAVRPAGVAGLPRGGW